MMRKWLVLTLGLALILSGCSYQVAAENDDNNKAPEFTNTQFEQLWEQEIYSMSSWTEDGTLYMTVLRPDQRAVETIRDLVGQDVVVIEEKEYFYIRGQITKIDTGSKAHGTILIENGDSESQCDKAYASVADYTKILASISQHGQDAAEALTFAELEVGQTVEVWVAGAVAESYPPQASAGIIKIVE